MKSWIALAGLLLSVVAAPAAPVIEEAPPPKPKASASTKPGVKVVKKKKDTRSPELIENEVAQAESRLNEISKQMGTPEIARDADRLIALNDEYQQTEAMLKNLYEEWERVTQEPAPASG